MIRRTDFLILAGGVILGLTLGLIYAWLIDPVELVNTTPDLLRIDHRHEWVRLVALSYAADGDLERAETRLEPLARDDVEEALVALIEAYAAQGRPAETMRALSRLANELGVYTPAMDVYLSASSATPLPPSPTPPAAEPTPSPTALPPTAPPATPTPIVLATTSPLPTPIASPYRVLTRTAICTGTASQLQVLVWYPPQEPPEGEEEEPPQRAPLTGVVLWLTWPGGADRAVTGLRPWIDPGYADFQLEPEVPYALSIDEPNAPVLSGLTAPACPAASQPGSWRIVVEVNDRL
jgi:hypothetical protein